MRFKRFVVYFVTIVLGLTFIYVSSYYHEAVRKQEKKPVFPNIKTEKVNRMTVKHDGNKAFSFEIVKKGKTWVIKKGKKDITANQGRVQRVLADVEHMSILSILSRDSTKFEKYGVDKSSAVYIEGFDDNISIFSFVVGGVAQDYSNSFIRKQGSTHVLLVDTSTAKDMSKSRWKESKVVDIERSLIKRFTYRQAMGRIYSFYKQDNAWHENNLKKKLNRNRTWYLLNAITDLTIQRNSSAAQARGFDEPLISVTIETESGFKEGFVVGGANKENKTFYVRRISDAHIFEVPVYKINGIIIEEKDLANG